jgi:hypothetical protein
LGVTEYTARKRLIGTLAWALTEVAPGQKRPRRGEGIAFVCLGEHLAGQKSQKTNDESAAALKSVF